MMWTPRSGSSSRVPLSQPRAWSANICAPLRDVGSATASPSSDTRRMTFAEMTSLPSSFDQFRSFFVFLRVYVQHTSMAGCSPEPVGPLVRPCRSKHRPREVGRDRSFDFYESRSLDRV